MAGSSRYAAILDANVLYPQLVRDLLLSLAACELYHARWSADINDEWTRNFAAKMPASADKIPAIVAAMAAAVPDSLVTGYPPLIHIAMVPQWPSANLKALQRNRIQQWIASSIIGLDH